MATSKLRDRDGIITREGLIFRVFGYSHPAEAYVCDVEYASASIFKSKNPKAFRNRGEEVSYKFYEDEGWKFVETHYPQHMITHEMLGKKVVAVNHRNVLKIKKPEEELKKLVQSTQKDSLVAALENVLNIAANQSGVPIESFGVFGSMLYGFHNPLFSDIDLTVYGKDNVSRLRETLEELYESKDSLLRNEFETEEALNGKVWRFLNLTRKEFLWHQRRKLIYSLFHGESARAVKTEFEPVKNWKEAKNEYDPAARIFGRGWVKMLVRVTEDFEGPFIPSIYGVEPLEVLEGEKDAYQVSRIVSYMEEFRLQVFKDEVVYVEGNLEEIVSDKATSFQIALTYCPRYYQQVLKRAR